MLLHIDSSREKFMHQGTNFELMHLKLNLNGQQK